MWIDFEITVSCKQCSLEGVQKPDALLTKREIGKQDYSSFSNGEGECLVCGSKDFFIKSSKYDLGLFEKNPKTLETAERIWDVLEAIDSEGFEEEAVIAFFENWRLEDFDQFPEIYIGEMELNDYAKEVLPELYEIPEKLEMYIDYEKFKRDLSYDVLEIYLDGRYFLFNMNN